MNFLSIRPRFHSSLTSPSCTRLLAPDASSLTLSSSPCGCREKPPCSMPLNPKWVPLSRLRPQSTPHSTSHVNAVCMGSLRLGGRDGAYGSHRMRGGGEAGQEGLHREPRLPRVSRDCAQPRAPQGPPLATCSLSPSIWERAGCGGGLPSGALCKSWCWLGVWVCGWGGGIEEGEINLFGWSRVRVSRFPYPGIAGGAAIGSQDHVGS